MTNRDTSQFFPLSQQRLSGSAGEGQHRVWFERYGGSERLVGGGREIADSDSFGDLVYIVGGGDRPHIGCVVMKVPGEEVRILTIGTHKEHHILVPMAEIACERYGGTVVITGGVHIDSATPEDIDQVVRNCEMLHSML